MPRPKKIFLNIDLNSSSIGQRIQYFRRKNGLTQQQLAEKLGVTRSTVNSYETDRIHVLDTTLIDIATILCISVDVLLGIKNNTQKIPAISLRLMKRMPDFENLPEITKKYIIKMIDDSIKANSMNQAASL